MNNTEFCEEMMDDIKDLLKETKKFTAEQFTPTKFSTAADKAKFANQFMKFVEGGYQYKDFPKWFYIRLSMTFGHIAHHNSSGFFETFFTCQKDKAEFMKQTMDYPCYGDPAWTFCDVEKALQKVLKDKRM